MAITQDHVEFWYSVDTRKDETVMNNSNVSHVFDCEYVYFHGFRNNSLILNILLLRKINHKLNFKEILNFTNNVCPKYQFKNILAFNIIHKRSIFFYMKNVYSI